MKNISNWNRKWHKTQNFPIFKVFYAIFVKFSTDFVDWNVEKSQQGTNLLSSSLFRIDLRRKISRWSAGVLFYLLFRCHRSFRTNSSWSWRIILHILHSLPHAYLQSRRPMILTSQSAQSTFGISNITRSPSGASLGVLVRTEVHSPIPAFLMRPNFLQPVFFAQTVIETPSKAKSGKSKHLEMKLTFLNPNEL